MAYCDLCEMNRGYCQHALQGRSRAAAAAAGELLISPSGMAHFANCPHKGDDLGLQPLGQTRNAPCLGAARKRRRAASYRRRAPASDGRG